jgi:hypothetical protein
MTNLTYPTSEYIYSKYSLVSMERRCQFWAKDIHNESIDQPVAYVIWEHCGKGSGCFWTDTNCSCVTGNRTEFCLEDIIKCCKFNGVDYTLNENGSELILTTVTADQVVITAVITAGEKMMIKWGYKTKHHYNSITPNVYYNEAWTDNHQITIGDIKQIQRIFDFNKM